MGLKYERILLKISGEALAGGEKIGLDYDTVKKICESIKKAKNMGLEIGVVVGGGNFWRGRSSGNMERTRADHIGMLATVMNSLAVADALEQLGVEVRVMTALSMMQIAEPYIRNRAVRHLEKGRVVIIACGTGNPFFSTDTASALRAIEINAQVMLKATLVDGVYDKDPKTNDDAKRYTKISYTEILSKNLNVIDSTAATLCRDNNLPMLLFDISEPENIIRTIIGDDVATVITE